MTLVDDRDRKSSFGFGGRRSMKRYERGLSVKKKERNIFPPLRIQFSSFFIERSDERSVGTYTHEYSRRGACLECLTVGSRPVETEVIRLWLCNGTIKALYRP